jgi:glycosyltransferase involved in cell wall biosynthesis
VDVPGDSFILYYHGTLVPERVPLALIHALAALPHNIRLRLGGYETIGAPGHMAAILQLATTLGVADRVEVLPLVERAALWQQLDTADVGLSLVPLLTSDANLEFMTGASNKPFEYLARGLALLLPARAEWQAMFGAYGATCDPQDPDSIACAILSLYEDRFATREMGEAGRRRIASEWNYERAFEPVLALLHG